MGDGIEFGGCAGFQRFGHCVGVGCGGLRRWGRPKDAG